MSKSVKKSASNVKKNAPTPAAKPVKAPKKTVRSLADLASVAQVPAPVESEAPPPVTIEVPESVAEAIMDAAPEDTTDDTVVVGGVIEAEEVTTEWRPDTAYTPTWKPVAPVEIEGVAEVADLPQQEDAPVKEDAGLVEADPRLALLAEIEQYVTVCGYTQAHIDRAHNMTLPQLHEYLASLRVSSGGSIQVAELLAEVEEAYAETLASEDVQRKLSLIEAKGADFLTLASRVHRALGSDVVVNGVRYQEYHELLKHLVRHSSVVSAHIVDIASLLRITIPEQLENGGTPIPVVSGMQLNTKATLYILSVLLNNMRSWAVSAANADMLAKTAQKQREEMEAFAALKVAQAKAAQDNLNTALAAHAAETSRVATYIVEDEDGKFLAKKHVDDPLSYKNLQFVDHPFDAIPLNSRLAAADLAERVGLHFKKELTPLKLVLMRA